MKTYYGPRHIRMVGKAWEIRATLRNWAGKQQTLQEYLTRREAAKHR
jgi:hypothetical protein